MTDLAYDILLVLTTLPFCKIEIEFMVPFDQLMQNWCFLRGWFSENPLVYFFKITHLISVTVPLWVTSGKLGSNELVNRIM